MGKTLDIGDLAVDVVLKDIKNVHLSVHPPAGHVRIAAPHRMSMDTIRLFAISKLAWIKKQQKHMREQERETPREYLDRESHYAWGRRYLLSVVEHDAPPTILLKHKAMLLHVRPGASENKLHEIVEDWYRTEVKRKVAAIIAKWEPIIGVTVKRFYVRRMKTRWGSCNPTAGTIRLNTDLAKKPEECLEYIVVHEMIHMLEPTHNATFQLLMDRYMPDWQHRRQVLNQLPVRHEEWSY